MSAEDSNTMIHRSAQQVARLIMTLMFMAFVLGCGSGAWVMWTVMR